MTWDKYKEQCAERLAQCYDKGKFDSEIRQIDETLKKNPPPDGLRHFWEDVLKRYREEGKPLWSKYSSPSPTLALHAAWR